MTQGNRQDRHCEPTGRANARPMTGSAKQSSALDRELLDCFVALLLAMAKGTPQFYWVGFQLQMPPDLHGQTWTRVSKACASRGLPCRRASLARAAPCGLSPRKCAVWTRAALTC